MARVRIGSAYRPAWFERRNSDGSYQWFNGCMSAGELRLQEALLARSRRVPGSALVWAGVGVALLGAAVLVFGR